LQSVDLEKIIAKYLISGWHPWQSADVAEKRATT
jgi:hypothetical protein